MKYIAKERTHGYVYNTGEKIVIEQRTELVEWDELTREERESVYDTICKLLARRMWDKKSATQEQLLLHAMEDDVHHDFYPSFIIPNVVLAEVQSGEQKGSHIWVDGSFLIPVCEEKKKKRKMKHSITKEELHHFIGLGSNDESSQENKVNFLFQLFDIPKHEVLTNKLFTLSCLLEVLEQETNYMDFIYHLAHWKGYFVDVVFHNGERYQMEHEYLCEGLWDVVRRLYEMKKEK